MSHPVYANARPFKTQWYVLYTTPRAEKQVEQRLMATGLEVFLPVHLCPRKWADRVKMIEVPLFSSYIFVKTTDPELRKLLKIPGVVRIVYHSGVPAVIRENEINAIRTFLDKAKEKELIHELGEDLLIACGPLKDISGKVKKINKSHLLLYIEQLGCSVCVAMNQVVKSKRVTIE
ncbi:MAG: UpxY family transcription antiterminator [Paludibacter sp.]|jgi:transcription antitermination factor NusG|nr:UpxY family transcription antiterminator [Paludibacter sp.]